jgi:hypothetical protein
MRDCVLFAPGPPPIGEPFGVMTFVARALAVTTTAALLD